MRRRFFVAVFLGVLGTASPVLAKTVNVTNATELTTALAGAAAGDEIVLANGTYHLTASPVCSAAGPISVHAATPLRPGIAR